MAKKTFKTIGKWKFSTNELESITNGVIDMKDEYAGDDTTQQEYYDRIIEKLAYASEVIRSFEQKASNYNRALRVKIIVQAEEPHNEEGKEDERKESC